MYLRYVFVKSEIVGWCDRICLCSLHFMPGDGSQPTCRYLDTLSVLHQSDHIAQIQPTLDRYTIQAA